MASTQPQDRAPLSEATRDRLRCDAYNLQAAAKRKGLTLDSWSEAQERAAAMQHFELGCHLHHFVSRRAMSFEARLDSVRRLFEAGIASPGYRFYTVFDFGERQFDACFEMGDSDRLVNTLLTLAELIPTGTLAACVAQMGWTRRHEAQSDLFTA